MLPTLNLPRIACALLAGLILPVASHAAQVNEPLSREATILLPEVSGPIDHLAVDIARKRLFVSDPAGDAVAVIALSTHQGLQRIAGLRQPRGLAYLPHPDLLAVANGADGLVRFYSGADFMPRGEVHLSADANNVLLDPGTGHLFVGYDTSRIGVIDPSTPKWLADIPLPSRAEGAGISDATGRLFVNVPSAGKIVMVDFASKTGASWLQAGLEGNFPMALDETGRSIMVVFRNPARLAIMDMMTGATTLMADTCAEAGGVSWDAKRGRVYVSCGSGSIDVVQRNARSLQRLARIATSRGAQASLFAPELDRFYLAVPATPQTKAAIQIYRVGP